MRAIRLSLCAALALAGVLLPTAAAAQAVASIDRVELGIWPEYDQPKVLYLYAIKLASGTSLPTSFNMSIPAAVVDQVVVAKLASDGKLYDTPYTSKVQGDWATITVQTDSLNNQIEYYGALDIQSSERDIVWTMANGPAIGDLSFKVQQPIGASALTVTPSTTQTAPGSDGLTYYSGDLGALAAGATPRIEVTYTRSTTTLTAQMLPTSAVTNPQPPISPAASAKGGLPNLSSLLPWIVGLLGVALLAVGGVMVVQMRRSAAVPARPRRRPSRSKDQPTPRSTEVGAIFCHQCGTQADPSDLFCRHCGTRLRT